MSKIKINAGEGQPQLRRVMTVAAAFFATLLALPVHSVTIPKIPLQSSNPVAPNILFILDDSGSMHGEIMPDELIFNPRICSPWGCDTRTNIGLVYPRADGVYGGADYINAVADVASGSGYGAMVRSPQINKIYYNPAVTYLPWAQQNGQLYPAASLTCALHNPERSGTGDAYCRNLTVDNGNYNGNYWQDCQSGQTCPANQDARTFWPSSYFTYDGSGDRWSASSYTKTEIRTGTASYSGEGRGARTDAGCSNGTCTYAAEIQNFANWYSYYRSRILSARAGIGRAFSGVTAGTTEAPAPRVGFTTINTVGNPVAGVRAFSGTDRSNFFSLLYGRAIPQNGTPLRRALDYAGKYYQDNDEPWSATPGTSSNATPLACRASYSILMTDGYWNGDGASGSASGNVDGTTGGSYTAADPFQDTYSGTLADVAMYYWKTDLRTTLANLVPTSTLDPANWQHMVTFGVGLGVSGTPGITRDIAFNAIENGDSIDWLEPTEDNKATKIDDLLHASLNSRGDFFSAADPKTFAEGLGKVLTTIDGRTGSASNVAANSVALKDETRIFQASYVPGTWTGELASYAITAADGVSTTAQWRASRGIPSTGRKVFTTTGVAATPGATFPTAAQITALGNSPNGHSIAAYLAGTRTGEQGQSNGDLRRRSQLLGDIVNSSPAYVKDTGTLYIGANDGMMHAIDASNGQELFVFVPNAVSTSALAKLKKLSEPAYSHEYYVDGPVAVSSRLETPSKNYLVGALGRGGKGVYFLDVTDPDSFAVTDIKPEYGEAANDADMGYVLGRPLIANIAVSSGSGNNKVTTKTPVAIVSNGVNSTNSSAALYVFNLATGEVLKKLVVPPPAIAPAGGNGLSAPRGWDMDGDELIDYVYAGDLQGNLWKFDLSDSDVADWEVANSGVPLFVAQRGTVRQPITGGLSLALDPVSFKPWVFFGTGKYIEQSDVANAAGVINTAVQSWYGVRDEGVAITNTNGGRTALQERTFTVATTVTVDGETREVRGFEQNAALPAAKKGWYVDLLQPPSDTALGERMVGDPFMLGSVLVAASIIPSPDPCKAGGTGYLNAIDAFTGTSVATPFFDVDGDGSFDDDMLGSGTDQVPAGSVDLGIAMPTSPTIVESLVVAGGSQGTTGSVPVNNPVLKTRISWREIIKD